MITFQNVNFIRKTQFIRENIYANLTKVIDMYNCLCRYNENLELEDAIHTAILTLKVSIIDHF